MTAAALDLSYVDASDVQDGGVAPCPREPPHAVAADGGDDDLVWVPFARGPRLSMYVAIDTPRRTYVLKGTFGVHLEYFEDGTVYAEHRRIPVHGDGRSVKEALTEFANMFDAQYRTLVEVDEAKLTAHAKGIRAQLLELVADVHDR